MSNLKERSCWKPVKELMGKHRVRFGRHFSHQFLISPRRLLHMMSYYKFASKIIGHNKRVLDVGCGEGLGTWLLAVECGKAKGIDFDHEAIEIGKSNWKDPRIDFLCADFLACKLKELFEGLVSFDVIEHILPENIDAFWLKTSKCLMPNGIAIIGTPNITSDQYASAITKSGHVNLYSGERLKAEMQSHFKHVFMFGASDEVVHTGFLPMAHYLMAMGVK